MSRSLAKWGLTAVLGVGLWVSTAGQASAQFMPGFRPGFMWANPYSGTQFNYNSWQQSQWGMNWVNPYNGMRMSFGYQSSWMGLPPGYPYPAYGYPAYGGYYNPYMAGGVGTYGGSSNSYANPFVREQLRVFKNAPVPNQEKGENPAPGNQGAELRNRPAGLVLTGLNRALIEPADRDILSGKVLNELATTIRGLESKGAKAESPLLPAELVSHVNYDGGPSASVIGLLRTGKPAFPTALMAPEYDGLRADLDKAMMPVLDPIAAGKRPEAAAVDRLSAATKKAKDATDAKQKNLPAGDATELNRFYTTLDSLAKVGKDSGTAGLFPQRWASVGATVSELIRHMDKYKLTFAPASAGDEDVYYSLHRGLVSYYAGLSQAKK
jgi:hypothetical protein